MDETGQMHTAEYVWNCGYRVESEYEFFFLEIFYNSERKLIRQIILF
jgi:hypothetical protein